ncbi:Lipoprotein NlpI [Arsenophonus endosymbiont of Aleurodicus floccissimus]|uniref:lipoprotein NlpI n=1 Tax=Arsenophonus endosymbiont of Aleurodicus floccissimus TaxID=2152761 RepID=UPI000E6B3990|nr:lipoprotein NlpI [Arsenophonus endosymbiont of Aleurodicus floccissimus]SPP32073.1 Lipoprotein NlpI [Arsenophonus endosymbiont of Aleurodicus floccissimus]
MNSFLRWLLYTAAIVFIVGCSSENWRKNEVFAVPLQQEVILARMEQILASWSLSDDEYAQLLYERGVLYDSLGLRALACNDFTMALAIRPDIPEVFNFLEIYFTQASNFDAAYEAFDSVLELDPTYNFARMNRGIALYYGGRYRLAQGDLLAYYRQDPNDPFRSLWLYLVEKEIKPKMAQANLLFCYNQAEKGQWGWNIVEFYLGKISEKTLMVCLKENSTDNTSLAEHLSETNFYLGKYYLSLGDNDNAMALFKLTVASNAHSFVEYRYALLGLALLGQAQDDLSESG